MAKQLKAKGVMVVCLADTGKGTVAKLHPGESDIKDCLADTGKGTVAKLPGGDDVVLVGLADTGKGTVAKRRPV